MGMIPPALRLVPPAGCELPEPSPEVGAAEHRVQNEPDQNEVQRQAVEVHVYCSSVVVGSVNSSGRAASRRRIHTTATMTPA